MQAVARKIVSTSAYITLFITSGVAIALLVQQVNPLLLFLPVFAVPVGLYVFSVIPLVVLKVRRLFSHLRWWHVLWFLLFLSGLTFRVRGAESAQDNPLDTAAFFRVFLVGLVGIYLLGFLTLQRHFRIGLLFRGCLGALTTYALFSALSTLWSVYPAWTLYKSIEYLVGVALIGAIVASVRSIGDFKRLFDWMWFLIGLVVLSVWLGVILQPQDAVLKGVGVLGIQIQGVFPKVAANGVGDLGATIGIVAFVRFLYSRGSSRRFYLAVLMLGLITLIFAQSRSPLIGFLLAVLVILYLDGRISNLFLLSLSVPVLLSLTPLGDKFWQFFLRGQSEELFFSLSGRVYYWKSALSLIEENPFLGYGAYAAGRFLVAKEFSSTLSSLHGTWPEVLIGTGVIGMLPLLISVIWTWAVMFKVSRRRLLRANPLWQQLRLEAVGIMTLLSVRSIFSVSFIWHPALTWLLILGFTEFLRRQYAHVGYPQPLPPTRR